MKKLILFIFLTIAVVSAKAEPILYDTIPSIDTTRNDGTYLWIPDSLKRQVQSVLDGKSKIVRDYSIVDVNEKVIVKGDTVNVIIKDRNIGRFNRGLFNYLFIPKGQWQFGLTASYGDFSSSDLQLLDMLSDVNFGGHIFSIRPSVSYFVKNNISVGVRFIYSSAKADIGSFKVDFDEDLNFNLSDIHYSNEEYSTALTCTQYLGLGRGDRFAVFNEVELSFSSGNGRFARPYDGVIKDTKTNYMKAELTFSPGVCVMIMKNVSFNLSFGVFGYHIKNEKQTVDGEKLGNRFSSGANFKFNIFNLKFGLGIHI